MKDEKLLQIIELFDRECVSQELDNKMTGVMNTASDNKKTCRKKTDIYLRSMDNDALNELVIMVKAGKYDEHRKNDAAWSTAKRTLNVDDLTGWSKLIGAVRLSDDECIKYLRSWSPRTITNDIYAFLSMEPMTARQKNLLRFANEKRKNNRFKHTNIETR